MPKECFQLKTFLNQAVPVKRVSLERVPVYKHTAVAKFPPNIHFNVLWLLDILIFANTFEIYF